MEICHRVARQGVLFSLQRPIWRLMTMTAGALVMTLLLPVEKVLRVGEAIVTSMTPPACTTQGTRRCFQPVVQVALHGATLRQSVRLAIHRREWCRIQVSFNSRRVSDHFHSRKRNSSTIYTKHHLIVAFRAWKQLWPLFLGIRMATSLPK